MRVPIRKSSKYSQKKLDVYMTANKLESYKAELEKIKKIIRPKAMSEVKRLAEMGDFSENMEYQIAKGRLRWLNARIDELEEAIKKAKLIKTGIKSDKVQIGSRVIIELDGNKKNYLLLGSAESDPINGVISHASPLGKSLIGRKSGDVFKISISDKQINCEIIEII